jgi:hypothetical protein
MRAPLILLLLLPLFASPVMASDERTLPEATNRQLKSELELAKQQQLYFVFDFPQRQVLFRTSGLTLATLKLSDLRLWGRPGGDHIRTLARKVADNPPKRESIVIPPPEGGEKPAEAKPAEVKPAKPGEPRKIELQALEIDDMPDSYTLYLSDGLMVTVHPAAEGTTRSRFSAAADKLYWYLSRPLISDWNYLKKKSYNEVLLVLPPREARMLYWSFTEGASCLIFWP